MKYRDLYEYLAARIHRTGCNHTLSGVRDFLDLFQFGHEDGEDVILDLQENGGFCDCEVLFNVMHKVDADREL